MLVLARTTTLALSPLILTLFMIILILCSGDLWFNHKFLVAVMSLCYHHLFGICIKSRSKFIYAFA